MNTGCRDLEPGIWSLDFGIWILESGFWNLEFVASLTNDLKFRPPVIGTAFGSRIAVNRHGFAISFIG
jgi:hypothetical protein